MAEVFKFARKEERVEEQEQKRLHNVLMNLVEAVDRGQITALAIVTTGPQGEYLITPPSRDVMLMLGGLEMLKQRMLERLLEDSVFY